MTRSPNSSFMILKTLLVQWAVALACWNHIVQKRFVGAIQLLKGPMTVPHMIPVQQIIFCFHILLKH